MTTDLLFIFLIMFYDPFPDVSVCFRILQVTDGCFYCQNVHI